MTAQRWRRWQDWRDEMRHLELEDRRGDPTVGEPSLRDARNVLRRIRDGFWLLHANEDEFVANRETR